MEKPENPRKYIQWWNNNFDDAIDLSVRKLYTNVSAFVEDSFSHSDEFKTLIHELHNYDAEYR